MGERKIGEIDGERRRVRSAHCSCYLALARCVVGGMDNSNMTSELSKAYEIATETALPGYELECCETVLTCGIRRTNSSIVRRINWSPFSGNKAAVLISGGRLYLFIISWIHC